MLAPRFDNFCVVVLQIWKCKPQSRIVVATPSNSAADVVAKRLLHIVPKSEIVFSYLIQKIVVL